MAPIRVMVVDDSVVVRKLVTDVLSADPAIEVVGTAVNGRVALAKLETLRPDLVTMDIEMPELDGIGAVTAIRAAGNRVPIVMFSTLTERAASATFDALAAGAAGPSSTAASPRLRRIFFIGKGSRRAAPRQAARRPRSSGRAATFAL